MVDLILPNHQNPPLNTFFLKKDLNGTRTFMHTYGFLSESSFLFASVAATLEVLGATLILFNIFPKIGALLLLFFVVPATFIFHADASDVQQRIQLLKNLAIIGGLLVLYDSYRRARFVRVVT